MFANSFETKLQLSLVSITIVLELTLYWNHRLWCIYNSPISFSLGNSTTLTIDSDQSCTIVQNWNHLQFQLLLRFNCQTSVIKHTCANTNTRRQIQKQKTLLIAGRWVLSQLQITCCLNVSSGPIHQRCLLHPFICGPILNTDFLFTLVLNPLPCRVADQQLRSPG